jgi:hypothetical protein
LLVDGFIGSVGFVEFVESVESVELLVNSVNTRVFQAFGPVTETAQLLGKQLTSEY